MKPRVVSPRSVAALACGTLVLLALADPVRSDNFAENIRPILEQYCFACHGADEPQAGIDLSAFNTEADALAAAEVWDKAARRVRLFEMPPPGSQQLSDVHMGALMGWIEANRKPADDCNELPSDVTQSWFRGHVMSRRLTREEYNNSIRDLVGLDLRPADAFPADGSGGEGFDNVGDTQFVSPILLENYLAAAAEVLDAALPGPLAARSPELASVRERLLPFEPSTDLSHRDAARKNVAALARRAFRRPVEDDEVDRLLTMYDRAESRGDDFEAAMKLPFKAILISPHFLFLPEPEPDAGGVYRLNQHQLAARLSYFLWASTPDDALLDFADAGRLDDEQILRDVVRRMLTDEKAHGFAAAFATQWLGLDALGSSVKPDSKRFPEFDERLAADMKAEAVALVEGIFREDRSLLELLDSDYAYINARLAEHYGLPAAEGAHLRRVTLTDRRRGGVVGLGAVLTATSYPLRTSPVIRGKWVLETILGSPVPPPPPNVGALPEDDHEPGDLTLRQQLEAHRTKPECAACHARMDPLGFGLENFDAIGRWRDSIADTPVDASGQLPSGEKFSGPAELKVVLASRKQEFITNFSRKMLGYALGRGLSRFDDCVVKASIENLEANGYRSSALIETIVLSYPFQHRYARK